MEMVWLSEIKCKDNHEGICPNCCSDNIGINNQGAFCRNCGLGVVRQKSAFKPHIFFRDYYKLQDLHYIHDEYGPCFDDEFYPYRLILPKYIKQFNKRFLDSRYQKWRIKVIKKFNGKCLKCGKKGRHCHHIQNYKQYPELRYKLKNGILFCKDCHEDFHTIFGVRNNNLKQITKFLNMNLEAV